MLEVLQEVVVAELAAVVVWVEQVEFFVAIFLVEAALQEVQVQVFTMLFEVEEVEWVLVDFYSNYKVFSDFNMKLQFLKSFV